MLARRIFRVGTTLLLAAGVLLGALLVLPALAGYQRYAIVSGSMTGTYDRGSVVFDEVVPVSELKVGDVITYRPPAGSGPKGLVTHRIAAITRDRDGSRIFRTKGDANEVADPWTFKLAGLEQARVRAGVPYVGFAVAALSDRKLRMIIVGLPALLIALSSLAGLWRDTEPDPAGSPA
jgi:signal peptidase I